MKRIFRVHQRAKTIRLTKDLIDEGFDGQLEGFANACTFVLVKPGTTLDQAIESLETIIRDMNLRKKLEQNVPRQPASSGNTNLRDLNGR
jgi:hypothetical protein